jgi:hypothetical protein
MQRQRATPKRQCFPVKTEFNPQQHCNDILNGYDEWGGIIGGGVGGCNGGAFGYGCSGVDGCGCACGDGCGGGGGGCGGRGGFVGGCGCGGGGGGCWADYFADLNTNVTTQKKIKSEINPFARISKLDALFLHQF